MIKDLQYVQGFLKDRKETSYLSLMVMLFLSQQGQAQMVNKGDLKVANNTILSVYMDYDNEATGSFINDGEVYSFQNYHNDGVITYSTNSAGVTYFTGEKEQAITGSQTADFQNLVFDNISALTPFKLQTTIAVGNNADFKNGIVNAIDPAREGKMIFKENAKHSFTGDQSFVDGKVQKIGNDRFEFPVGNELVYRPSVHDIASDPGNVYTTQYFNKNSDDVVKNAQKLYPHTSKQDDILTINNREYWQITKDQGEEKIILSLTLKQGVTPSDFFTENTDTELAIVRWDENQAKWVNDHGAVSEPLSDLNYSKLLSAQVGGYGIFTMAIVKKTPNPEPNNILVYNAISPNDDGVNDTFLIEGIAKYPDNEVEIYNRWGVKVYDAKSYNESDNMFRGYSDGRATVKRGEKLPTGTYFYILKYNDGVKGYEKSGYLYINNQ